MRRLTFAFGLAVLALPPAQASAQLPLAATSAPHKPRLLSIPHGATVRWRFRDDRIHDATMVRGPRGFATATVKRGHQSQRFRVPGEYRLYCSTHPVLMSQVVRVR